MNKQLIFTLFILFTLLNFLKVSAQNNNTYIKRGQFFTKTVNVKSISNHGDDIVNVNVFSNAGKKIEWGTARTIISYTYLGIDNQHNLHLQREETDFQSEETDDNLPSNISNLIFALDTNKSGDITLIGERSLKEPLLIKIHVEASNNFIKIKYLGDLPVYKEE